MSAEPDALRITALLRTARSWVVLDPDPTTRLELTQLADAVESGAVGFEELAALVDGRLASGTAGLRGPLGAGPRRMNVLVAAQTAAGLARALLAEVPDATARGVVVGHDARHGSVAMASAMCQVLTRHGMPVGLFDDGVPTPLVATTVRARSAAGGVVVTASHNPASDNGIKVYWSDGAQIAPPIDERIAEQIDRVAAEMAATVEADPLGGRAAAIRVVLPPGRGAETTNLGTCRVGGPADAYEEAALAGRAVAVDPGAGPGASPTVPLALTSLHGVGAELLERVLVAAGHTDLHQVVAQRDPDPDFPTVAFPNPEEPGTLDMVVDLARSSGCAAALANDPDADRVAVAVPTPDGSWRSLTGDEVGALLCARGLRRAAADGVADPLVVTTVVSSQQCAAIASAAGAHFAETLTGFKWLCRPALAHPDWTQVLAYEEALGYAVGDARDKDGITAALAIADLVVELAAVGRTLLDELDALALAHGVHVTRNGWTPLAPTSPVGAPGGADDLVARLVERPPERWGGRAVVDHDRPAPDVLRWWTDDGTRIALRPSGTEPKLKHYCEAVVDVGPSGDLAASRALAEERLDAVVADIERTTA